MDRAEMERMQRDAENRMREMKARSDRFVKNDSMPPVPDFVSAGKKSDNSAVSAEESRETNKKPPARKGFDILKMLNFEHFKLDNDALLIITLIFLLSTDDCDELLLLALIYIML